MLIMVLTRRKLDTGLASCSFFVSVSTLHYGLREATVNLLAILVVFCSVAFISRSRVYEKLSLDILEGSFILNICLLTTVTFYIRSVGGNQGLITNIFVGVAFAEFVGIVVFHCFFRILKFQCAHKLRAKVQRNAVLNRDKQLPLIADDFVHEREK